MEVNIQNREGNLVLNIWAGRNDSVQQVAHARACAAGIFAALLSSNTCFRADSVADLHIAGFIIRDIQESERAIIRQAFKAHRIEPSRGRV